MNDSKTDSTLTIRDREHLKMLAVFHIVLALGVMASAALGAWSYHTVSTVFSQMSAVKQFDGTPAFTPPPAARQVTGVLLVLSLCASIPLIASATLMLKNRGRTFSLVTAGLACLFAPLGTVLGVLTIMVLTRDSVREAYR